ncbi:MAG: S41 family peptidase [Planctomycetota bacterium]|jgi:tricorn protease-like protein/C-terminal processing protease CtpA/Prc
MIKMSPTPLAPVIAVAGTLGVAVFGLTPTGTAEVQPHPGMLRYPDVSRTEIVFVYANDLWLVPRDGGEASPLASPPGQELFPKFCPDGETIAFVGNYDGNRDLYTISRTGGVPVRVTHHPAAESLCGWTPDGELLFYANGRGGLPRQTQLFTVGAAGGLPKRLPLPYGANGAISPDGKWLAYTPHSRDRRTWKRYRGGMATDIWLFDLKDHTSKKITDWEGTDSLPMWYGKKLYYLSDAGPEHRLNIWSYDTATAQREQVTTFSDYDVKWPSMGPGPTDRGEIVFQNGADLFLFDLRTNTAKVIEVIIPGDRPTIRPKRVDAADFARWWHISSTGKRALIEARGDIWTAPAEHGSPRNLTRTSGVAEREASWSPDARWIAYFSDATGEYELYVTQSDGKGETKRLTSGSATFYHDPIWSPDSKRIVFTDKANRIHLHTIESGETKIVDKNPWGQGSRPSWSHDSRWLAYDKADDDKPVSAIWLYNVETDERQQVTSGVFPDSSPAFDRKGDYLYFASSRQFSPTYSDIDTTFIYNQSQVLLAVPLREDIESPWLPESDEESWEEETEEEEAEGEEAEAEPDAAEEGAEAESEEEEEEGKEADEPDAAKKDDGVSGTWEGTLSGGELPPGLEFVMTLSLAPDGTLTGSVSAPMGSAEISGTYDADTGEINAEITTEEGATGTMVAKISGSSISGTVTIADMTVEFSGQRTSVAAEEGEAEKEKEAEVPETVEIDMEGFEGRSMQLPVPSGNFGQLAVNHKNQLIYARFKPGSPPSLMLFDIEDEKKEEKTVAKGVGGFELSADGKKLILLRGGGASIQNASAGATAKNVVTAGMTAHIDPREEWQQLFVEAWRLQRDYLYVENMHGVDWPDVRDRYEKMLDDCVTREDVSYVIREMISELNIGHAYYFGGDVEHQPSVSVGMLGVDWTLENGAYRIAGICQGAAWDVDARNPLREPGVGVKEGDYLLAVNGIPVDTSKDPWAAFVGLAGRTITITVSEKPELDEDAREVVVKPTSNEYQLRYREWIERNRAYVERMTDGQVGYIYVPDTSVPGQNDLVRQYFGQIDKKALIIDERWNGGGQIPTRFIEMLNRPITNYWARRDSKDFKWPPDAHHGPKCMLINGLAGSGGDLFPWLFKQAGLGKLIGTRTWGGLVGLSGNPGLIDGGYMSVPTFGFYEKDGTWGVEGHGVDPDIEVIDDPALMVDGGDPQLDSAIALMLSEIEEHPYVPPTRPADPDRSGMGIRLEDR